MKLLMMAVSLCMLGAGTFCIANSTVAIGSVAFIIGVVFCAVGVCELLLLKGTSELSINLQKEYLAQSFIMIIVGIVFLSGQMLDEASATLCFALWMSYEGVQALAEARILIKDNSTEENIFLLISFLNLVIGVYMFFNNLLFDINTLTLIGLCISLLAIKKLILSLDIDYKKPAFLSGNQEKLQAAEREEKKAMAKAKSAIRESKEIQRKIEKIKADIAEERRIEAAAKIAKHDARSTTSNGSDKK